MVVDTTTLERLRALERLYAEGYRDDVVDLAVRKLVAYQVEKDAAQVETLRAELAQYEQRYGMDSAHFYGRYEAGEMGDDADVFEWAALYQMHARLSDAVQVLRAQLN